MFLDGPLCSVVWWPLGGRVPDLHERNQILLEKIYASLLGIKMTSANFQSFRSLFTIPTKPLLFPNFSPRKIYEMTYNLPPMHF